MQAAGGDRGSGTGPDRPSGLRFAHRGGVVDGAGGLRVLCVDDYSDIRELLSLVLGEAGYDVTTVGTAEEALALLRSKHYHLLISDYDLPERDGTWLIRHARQSGLLARTEAVLLTGAYDLLRDVQDIPIIKKPIDVDGFLLKIYDLLHAMRDQELETARRELEQSLRSEDQQPAVRLELLLYISAASPSSLKAMRNLQTLLRLYRPGQVGLTVVDLSRERPPSADEDRIVFTPTVVQRRPEPRAYLLGNLENIQALVDLIDAAGVEKR